MLLYVHRDCKDYWGRAITRAATQAITDIHPFFSFFFFLFSRAVSPCIGAVTLGLG